MFKERRLEYLIKELIKKLEKSNLMELGYLLGDKREIIRRNLLAGIFRGVGIRNGSDCNNCYINTIT
ncbi:MAG: hypothetical protein HUJ68_09140 [Clostridia bacterium]|mgnify:CR=1 FL=1|nr:hypothetical protein [Clostridia bacterium]